MAENTRRSIQELSEEVATNPNSTAFVELAAAYRERGDLDRAMRLCLRGLQRHPTHVEAHFELGLIYEARGERELALDEWGVVHQLAPDHVASRFALIRLYIEEGRAAEAVSHFREAERVAPNDPRIAEFRGSLENLPDDGGGEPQATIEKNVFEALEADHPGTLAVLLVDSDGQVLEGHMPGENGAPETSVGVNLVGAKTEAERVASYLQLGELKGMIVESSSARLSISPVGQDVIVVATRCDLPAGQAARVVQRAWDLAEEYLSGMGR